MTLELILWIIAGIIISEILFIFAYKNEWYSSIIFYPDNWMDYKFLSFIIGGMFTSVNYVIVFNDKLNCIKGEVCTANYINILWSFLVLGEIGLLFLINYGIKELIDGRRE